MNRNMIISNSGGDDQKAEVKVSETRSVERPRKKVGATQRPDGQPESAPERFITIKSSSLVIITFDYNFFQNSYSLKV
jgi:hypothetical protein